MNIFKAAQLLCCECNSITVWILPQFHPLVSA